VAKLKAEIGASVSVENLERLLMSGHSSSKFDVALSGLTPPHTSVHSDEILAEIAKLLKPSGDAQKWE
jgi:hypothetical protein